MDTIEKVVLFAQIGMVIPTVALFQRKNPLSFFCTPRSKPVVETKIIADPDKSFQEFVSEELLILLRDRSCLELILVFSNFQAWLFLQDKWIGISLKAVNSSKNF